MQKLKIKLIICYSDVNYDDINALLRKYGIEPIQPRTYNPSSTTLISNTTTSYGATPSLATTTVPNNFGSTTTNFNYIAGNNIGSSYEAPKYDIGSTYLKEESNRKSYLGYGTTLPAYESSTYTQGKILSISFLF